MLAVGVPAAVAGPTTTTTLAPPTTEAGVPGGGVVCSGTQDLETGDFSVECAATLDADLGRVVLVVSVLLVFGFGVWLAREVMR